MFRQKLKAVFARSGKMYKDYTDSKSLNPQVLGNKLQRNNLKVSDLVDIASFLELDVAFIDKDGKTVETFTINDFNS